MTSDPEANLRVPPSRVWTDWPKPKRILARIPNWVGDVVMTTPALVIDERVVLAGRVPKVSELEALLSETRS